MSSKPVKNLLSPQAIFLILLSILALTGFLQASYALACGIIFGYFFKLSFQPVLTKLAGQLLKVAIVLLGFSLSFSSLIQTASDSFVLILCIILLALGLGLLLSRLLKINSQQAWLISSGTAICGGSAIAAVGSSIKADSNNMVISLAIVFILNAIALFIFPVIGHWLEMSQQQFGLWAALGIHDTSSVVGAASQYGQEALEVATTSKLSRALWIIPLALLAALSQPKARFKLQIPLFIVLFIVASLIGTYISSLPSSYIDMVQVSTYIKPLAKGLFCLSLLWMGASLDRQAIKALPLKSLLMGLILWLLISAGSLLYILHAIN